MLNFYSKTLVGFSSLSKTMYLAKHVACSKQLLSGYQAHWGILMKQEKSHPTSFLQI